MKYRTDTARVLCLTGLCLAGSPLLAQQTDTCTTVGEPATPAFDFTGDLSRWGSRNSYQLDDQQHYVRSLTVNRLPIFDETNPDENNWLYRLANRLHADTSRTVIADQLLFTEGSAVDEHSLAESERLLRQRHYVGDARIRVLQDCGPALDLEVVSKEIWTLTPEISFNTSGGHSSGGIGIRDSNFLGSGQHLGLRYKQNEERSSSSLIYRNPNIRGSRLMFNSELTSNSDGHHYQLESGLPFYSTQSPFSWHTLLQSDHEMQSQYLFGDKVSQLEHDYKVAEISAGFALNTDQNMIYRLSGGLHSERHTWQPGTELPAMPGFRQQLDLDYPFVELELLEDNYHEAFNITQIRRTEDLHLGKHFSTRLGYAPGDQQSLIFAGHYSDTLLYGRRLLLQLDSSWDGRWDRDSGQWQDSLASLRLDYYRGQTEKRMLYLGLEANRSWHLNNGLQLELGGSNGLRGYDSHFLQGKGSLRVTAEQRYFSDVHVFNLLRVGYAAFVDAGRIYGNENPVTDSWFSNAGFGLRLTPSKAESGQMIHIDIAWPLNREAPGVDGAHLLVEAKKSF